MANLSIQVTCPQCGSKHQANTRLAGRSVRCPNCDASVRVPAATTVPADFIAPDDSIQLNDARRRGPAAGVDDAAGLDAAGAEDRGRGKQPAAAVELPDRDPQSLQPPVVFASDPVFDSPGHHSATDLPNLPPALQPDFDDGDPPARVKRKEDELDMTPMVDVTFLLLIFFMVTASFSLQKSIEMPRQQTDAPSTNVQQEVEDELDMVTVQIDEYGSFLVLAPDWERETPGKQNLIKALREAIGEGGRAVRLVIEVHEDTKLRYLVDCMDAGTISGYSELQVTQVDGFD